MIFKKNGSIITHCNSTKVLGLVIDKNFSWNYHIQLLLKLSRKLGLLRHLSFSLPSNILSCLYFSIIQPFLDYCISVGGRVAA